jgi:ABC-type branched-subunit amino acid transport system substrate-binding protein
MRRRALAAVSVTCALALVTAACGDSSESGGEETTTGSSGNETIKLGYLTSFTGANSASFSTGIEAAQARLDLYKEEGGECADTTFELVKGDDASSTQGALTATQKLVQQDDVYAVLGASSFFFGAAQYATTQAKDTPVIGGAFDGSPQWQEHPDNNLFPYFPVPEFGQAYTPIGEYFKFTGATKVAGIAFNSPSSQAGLEDAMTSIKAAGLERGYTNNTVAFGSKDVGPLVLGIMESGSDALYLAITPDTGLAVIAGLRQAGWKGDAIVTAAGYGDLLGSPQAVQLAQGVAFTTSWAPIELETEATKRQSAALKEKAGIESGVPGFAQSLGWLSADLFLHGLEKAGCDASQAEFMSALSDDSSWDGGGLYPQPTDFSEVRGSEQCSYYSILEGDGFTPTSQEPICGGPI